MLRPADAGLAMTVVRESEVEVTSNPPPLPPSLRFGGRRKLRRAKPATHLRYHLHYVSVVEESYGGQSQQPTSAKATVGKASNQQPATLKLMRELEQVFFETREMFRTWLGKNHKKSPGIWMIYYKKHTGTPCIEYREALEEALCFGWIDSTLRRIDDDRYVRSFTPRTNTSNWSDVNKKIVLELIENGKMTEAGLQKIDVWLKTGKVDWKFKKTGRVTRDKELQVPDFFLKALSENEPALAKF